MPTAVKKSKVKKKQTPAVAAPPAPRQPGLRARAAREAERVLLPDGSVGRRVFLGILLAAFGLRTVGLTEWVPVIGDEAIYMHWAEIVEHQGEWFVSLLDAKPPLQTWLLAIARMLVGGDPLLQARLLSVGAALLSTIGLFAVGKLLSGDEAGLAVAGLYAVFPIAVFQDRLAYTESMVNCFGIAITAASLWAFEKRKPGWGRLLFLGLILGLGAFTKQSVLLFAHFPALIALWRGRQYPWRSLTGCVVIYAITALFFGVTIVAMPEGPDTDWRNPAIHRADYYVTKAQLLEDPLRKIPLNWPTLVRSGRESLTVPMLMAAAVSFCYLLWRQPFAALVLAAVGAAPLFGQCVLLSGTLYPVRWAFPHFWPLPALVGLASAEVWRRYIRNVPSIPVKGAIAVAAGLAVVGPMGVSTAEVLRDPLPFLRAGRYMAQRAHVGYGNREAVEFLLAESAKGPLVVLTDPIPGPPGDTIFPYLNHFQEITVYEAWWMKLAYRQPILPVGPTEVMKSQYQRITDKVVYFSHVERVYYVTDSNYHPEEAVHDRQPSAERVASFPKPFNDEAVEVYRLK